MGLGEREIQMENIVLRDGMNGLVIYEVPHNLCRTKRRHLPQREVGCDGVEANRKSRGADCKT